MDYSAIFPYQMKPLKIVPFNQLEISTRTELGNLETNINLNNFFKYVEIVYIQQSEIKRTKIKIKEIKPPGSILSVCYCGQYRGVQTRQSPKPFLNQASFIMSVDTTNVNFKLFNNGIIQITGCKTKQHGYDIIKYVVQHGKSIEKKHNIIIFETEPCLTNLKTAMINVDFDLGFNIDRNALDANIDGLNGFKSCYDSGLSNSGVSVKIERPQENSSHKKHDSFICFHTGSVILSGNDLTRMEEIYYLFHRSIDMIKDKIVSNIKNIKLQRIKLKIKLDV